MCHTGEQQKQVPVFYNRQPKVAVTQMDDRVQPTQIVLSSTSFWS